MVTPHMPRTPGSDAASQRHRRTQWRLGRGGRAYLRVRRALVVAVSLALIAPLDLRFPGVNTAHARPAVAGASLIAVALSLVLVKHHMTVGE